MKILFTVQPLFGHFHVMVPLASALKAEGHQVAFASSEDFRPIVERAGFQHIACGLNFDGKGNFLTKWPEWQELKEEIPDPGLRAVNVFVRRLAPKMAEDLVALLPSYKPDLIVRGSLELGGYIAAEVANIPHATVSWGFHISTKHICPEVLVQLRNRYELPMDDSLESLDKYLVFNFMPESWAPPFPPFPPVTHRFCSPPYNSDGNESLPDWIGSLPKPVTVHASLGTVLENIPDVYAAIIDAFRSEEMNLILTVDKTVPHDSLGPLPDHIKLISYLPHSVILPRCDAVICHGGFNTLCSAFWNGLPVVLIPFNSGDLRVIAQNCERLGLGIIVEENPPNAEKIRQAVKKIIEQETYRKKAETLQAEMKALPPLTEAVRQLESLSYYR